MKRSERLGAMTMLLTREPNRIHTLNEFCEIFDTAKSTVSEDIELIRTSLERFGYGVVETLPGPNGGVRYRPISNSMHTSEVLNDLAERLSGEGRRLPGDFLFTADISADPRILYSLAQIFALRFACEEPDIVLTMETKGIPIALMTAHMLSVPLVIARRDSRAYEGSAVKINYVAGVDGNQIETMALSRRMVQERQKVLIIDDFMKGGGTLNGMVELMREFNAEVVGIGVLIEAMTQKTKMVENAQALLLLDGFDPITNKAKVRPNPDFL